MLKIIFLSKESEDPPPPQLTLKPYRARVDMPKQKQETAEERKNKLVMAEIDRAVKAYKNDH